MYLFQFLTQIFPSVSARPGECCRQQSQPLCCTWHQPQIHEETSTGSPNQPSATASTRRTANSASHTPRGSGAENWKFLRCRREVRTHIMITAQLSLRLQLHCHARTVTCYIWRPCLFSSYQQCHISHRVNEGLDRIIPTEQVLHSTPANDGTSCGISTYVCIIAPGTYNGMNDSAPPLDRFLSSSTQLW